MVQGMKENGETIKPMAKELYITLMVMYTKEVGKMTRLMDSANTLMTMERLMKETGARTSKMEEARRHGQMEPST